jgi:glycosyltransferase involved in cell wall biosynthesis
MPFRSHPNRYFQLFADALERGGIEVLGLRSRKAILLRFDILHVHFPAFFCHRRSVLASLFWTAIFIATLFFLRLSGKRIVYSVHNIDPHPSPYHREWIVRPYITAFHNLCDSFVFLSRTSQDEFHSRFPDQRHKLCSFIAHPPYPTVLMDPARRRKAREALYPSDDCILVGILGAIKPYKGLRTISELPEILSNGKQVRVVVAGEVEAAFQTMAQRILNEFPTERLIRIDRPLSDTELDELIQCLDVVLLPYSAISNSGFALLALSNRARILASDLALFRELQESVGLPWVYCYDLEPAHLARSLADALDRFSLETVSHEDQQRLSCYLDSVSFCSTGHEFRDLYDRTRRRNSRSSTLAS